VPIRVFLSRPAIRPDPSKLLHDRSIDDTRRSYPSRSKPLDSCLLAYYLQQHGDGGAVVAWLPQRLTDHPSRNRGRERCTTITRAPSSLLFQASNERTNERTEESRHQRCSGSERASEACLSACRNIRYIQSSFFVPDCTEYISYKKHERRFWLESSAAASFRGGWSLVGGCCRR